MLRGKMVQTPKVIIHEALSDDEEYKQVANQVVSDESNDELSEASDNSADLDVDCENETNLRWADSIAKILNTNKPKKKKTLVLSRAKKLTDALVQPQAKSAGYQVEAPDGTIKEEKILQKAPEELSEGNARKKKRDILSVRVRPSILEKDRERLLAKIATKGVVQLFNAVKQQQRDISTRLDKAGRLDVKRSKALKSVDKQVFLDTLMGEKAKSVNVDNELSQRLSKGKRETTETTWNVLRDDFMMSSNKIKDWDKKENEVEQQNIECDYD